jgi:hypothetical protein
MTCRKRHRLNGSNYSFTLFFSLLVVLPSVQCEQRIVEEPGNTHVRLNGTAILKCRVEEQSGAVQWQQDGFGLGTQRDLPFWPRYTMVGSPSRGEWHLQIVNATIADDAEYVCGVSGTVTEPGQKSRRAKLTVLVSPSHPKLVGDHKESIHAVEHQPLELTCQSSHGRPAARISWAITSDKEAQQVVHVVKNDTEFEKKTQTNSENAYGFITQKTVEDDNGMLTVTSKLTILPTKANDRRYIACLAEHETYGREIRSASVALDAWYSPAVKILLDESASSMKEGGKAVLKCFAEAKPIAGLTYAWSGNSRLKTVDAQTAVLEPLQDRDHLTQINCTASNKVGQTTASYQLNVSYGPRIQSTSQVRIVQHRDHVTFNCEADSNPPADITWTRKSNPEVLAKGPTFTIDSVENEQVGEYECVARIPGFKEQKVVHQLHVKGRPVVHLSENMVLRDNDAIVLICEVRSRPYPREILWLKDGRRLDVDAARMQINEKQRDFGVESKLMIQHMTEADFGTYNCSATNEFGSHSMSIDLFYQNLWEKLMQNVEGLSPTTIIVALFVAIIVFGCLLLLCCYKVRHCGETAKGSRFSDQSSDVNVKCEIMDGGQWANSEGYNSPAMYNGELICGKDYISVPQGNPDLDYLPAPNCAGPFIPTNAYANQPLVHLSGYEPSDVSTHYDRSYGSFTSGMSNPGAVGDMYGGGIPQYKAMDQHVMRLGPSPLETLTEVATPDTENGGGIGTGGTLLVSNEHVYIQERPISRLSTHV